MDEFYKSNYTMGTGTLIKSTSFNPKPYWVVKCDIPNLSGTINGELPINPESFNYHPWKTLMNTKVKFNVVELPKGSNRFYARLPWGKFKESIKKNV